MTASIFVSSQSINGKFPSKLIVVSACDEIQDGKPGVLLTLEPIEEDLDINPRCVGVYRGECCNKLLARSLSRPWEIICPRCGATNFRS